VLYKRFTDKNDGIGFRIGYCSRSDTEFLSDVLQVLSEFPTISNKLSTVIKLTWNM